ncbi:hypothetical protein [Amycolatopsis nigrescens]|uniref:hypothetical protein n=1 Tax=Amycolatopsis nigrescens TaxID=381445 RepID=UPI00036CDE40|nr:hypothetical protein [Amycolatopsis nigrescens]
MNSFFGELGRKLAEKWFSLLMLPGLLLTFVATVAAVLGHAHALDWNELVRRAGAWSTALGARPPAAQALVLVAVLFAAVAAGFVVGGLTGVTQRLWLGSWADARPAPLSWVGRKLVARRQKRWSRAHEAVGKATGEGERNLLAARRNGIAMTRPSRPTWMGDRIAGAELRVYHEYQVDLQSWWPRLWLVLDDTTRAELRAARSAFDSAVNQATWAVGYLLAGLFWWPAIPVAAGIWATGWLRGRGAVRTYADLIESTVDIYATDLAVRLRALKEDEPFTRETGADVTFQLRKGT